MIRLAHLSDSHLGYRNGTIIDQATGRNQRAVDVEEAFLATCRDIAVHGPDAVIHSGDIFHSHKPSWDAVDCFIRGMRLLERLPVVLIAGNHDMSAMRQSSTVFDVLRSALPGVHLVTGYEPLSIDVLDGLVVHCLPHGALTHGAGVSGTFWPHPTACNVLVAHGMAAGLPTLGEKEPGEREITDELLADQWDYVALGHYHRHGMVRDRAYYAGSTERMGFSDEPVQPGWYAVHVDCPGAAPVVQRMETRARPMASLPEVHAGMTTDWGTLRGQLASSLGSVHPAQRADMNVRIPLRAVSLRNRALAKEWLVRQPHGYWSASIAVGKERAKPAREEAAVGSEVEAVALPSLGTLFAEYVEGLEHPPEVKTALVERGGAALARAAELTQETE